MAIFVLPENASTLANFVLDCTSRDMVQLCSEAGNLAIQTILNVFPIYLLKLPLGDIAQDDVKLVVILE